ncbi:peroxiredoxin-like family protein [Paenibacillus sp. SI8]|uniref:peroxiredoxin-like family protein n=1 Tax=unclassified Paenibacillus TaxID=185978 RepID=UPI0034679E09
MMEHLNKQLQAVEQELKAVIPLEAYRILQQSIEDLQLSGIASGLQVGEEAIDFTLKDALGREINLFNETARGPVILTFYRGGWCPYCNLQLRAYQKVLPQIQELGASIIAVSPQTPDHTLSQQEKEQLSFLVASDTEGHVANQYKVLYEVSDSLKSVLQGFGGDLAAYNGTDRWILPVPATFVIDSKSVIQFAHVDPNFMRRLEPEIILEVLRKIEGGIRNESTNRPKRTFHL